MPSNSGGEDGRIDRVERGNRRAPCVARTPFPWDTLPSLENSFGLLASHIPKCRPGRSESASLQIRPSGTHSLVRPQSENPVALLWLPVPRSAGRRGARRPFEFGWIQEVAFRRDLTDCDTRRQKRSSEDTAWPAAPNQVTKNSEPRARKDNRVALPTESRAGSTPNMGWQKSVARKKSARSPQIPTPN